MYSERAVKRRAHMDLTMDVDTLRAELLELSPAAARCHVLILCKLWQTENLLMRLDMGVLARATFVRREELTRWYWPELRPKYELVKGARGVMYFHHRYLTFAAERLMGRLDRAQMRHQN